MGNSSIQSESALTILGAVFLLVGLILVPQNQVFADTDQATALLQSCPEKCNNGCKGPKPCGGLGNKCKQLTEDDCMACGCQEDPDDRAYCLCQQQL